MNYPPRRLRGRRDRAIAPRSERALPDVGSASVLEAESWGGDMGELARPRTLRREAFIKRRRAQPTLRIANDNVGAICRPVSHLMTFNDPQIERLSHA